MQEKTSISRVSLILAVRNERGGLAAAVEELDRLEGFKFELIFVEGGSTDGTYEELLRLATLPHRHKIVVLKQDGTGKKDAVVKGLMRATGEMTFVYDDDGEIATEELPKFINLLKTDKNLFLNGDRLKLPMEKKMRLKSHFGNRVFSLFLSLATGTYIADPLCGIKGTWTENYKKMMASGTFDNDLDRFAEIDQLLGARRLGLKIKELPVVYHNRRYGNSKVNYLRVAWKYLMRLFLEIPYRIGLSSKSRNILPKDKNGRGMFNKWKVEQTIFVAALIIVALLSFRNLLTYPRIWQDESSTIEQAHNILRYGSPDIEVAPGRLTGVPYLIQSTGYPVELSLALFFELFRYGFIQARIYMLIWTLSCLIFIFYIAKKLFGAKNALLTFFLIASFSSFFNSGRTVVGEIPGFLFLLIGLYYFARESYFTFGLFAGLAVVTKLSVFSLVIPATAVVLLFHRTNYFKNLGKVALGMIPAGILWFAVVTNGVFNLRIVKEMLMAYSNPFESSQSVNILGNIFNFFHSPTLIYFLVLFLVILITRFFNKGSKYVILYDFTIVYSIFAFTYYLRSPGWLRFILIAELLILFLLPHAVLSLSGRFLGHIRVWKINWEKIAIGFVIVCVFIQTFRFATSANIFYSDSDLKVAAFLNKQFPDKSVAVVNSLPLAVLLKQQMIYKVITTGNVVTGNPKNAFIDSKPLFIRPPVDVFVIPDDRTVSDEEEKILNSEYRFLVEDNGFIIYEHINSTH